MAVFLCLISIAVWSYSRRPRGTVRWGIWWGLWSCYRVPRGTVWWGFWRDCTFSCRWEGACVLYTKEARGVDVFSAYWVLFDFFLFTATRASQGQNKKEEKGPIIAALYKVITVVYMQKNILNFVWRVVACWAAVEVGQEQLWNRGCGGIVVVSPVLASLLQIKRSLIVNAFFPANLQNGAEKEGI